MPSLERPEVSSPGADGGGPLRADRSWRLFLAAVVGMALVHATTLTISPPPWADEIQIVDCGRTAIPGADLTYGVNWSAAGRPIQWLYYVGCVIHECAYRCAGDSLLGPRFSALLGASLAGLFIVCWLRAAGITPWIACVGGCCFLWDPLFVQGYRGARLDGWCMAFMLAALWCVRRAATDRNGRGWLLVAGALVSLGGLVWPSAVLLLPLLLHEIIVSRATTAVNDSRRSDVLTATWPGRMLVVGGSAALVMALLLLPMWAVLRDMAYGLSSYVTTMSGNQSHTFLPRCRLLPTFFLQSPLLPVVAVSGALVARPRSWFLAFLVALVGAVVTMPYNHRVVYLLPYFVYGCALFADGAWRERPRGADPAALVPWIAAVLVLWGAGGIAARTAVAAWERQRRDPQLAERLVDDISQGRRGRVLLRSWNLYYPFRSRGWAYWGPCDLRTPGEIERCLDYDLVVHDERAGVHPLDEALRMRGYVKRTVAVAAPADGARVVAKETQSYGPYVVYTHPDWDQGTKASPPADPPAGEPR